MPLDSHPKWKQDPFNTETVTKHCDYHGLDIEIKSNHPLTDSYNYALDIWGSEQRAVSARAELASITNPSPVAHGNKEKK